MGTVVCAVDDSPAADEALRVAVQLSEDAELRLVVVHVDDEIGATGQRGRALLDRLSAAHALNGGADKRVELGERARSIARVAAEEAASVIVIGSHRSRFGRRVRLSRLSAELAATANCPVLVAPPAATR